MKEIKIIRRLCADAYLDVLNALSLFASAKTKKDAMKYYNQIQVKLWKFYGDKMKELER